MKKIKLPLQSEYPNKIHFSDVVYRVKFKKGLKCYGYTDSSKKLIVIKKGISPRQTLCTFVHELLHVIEFDHPVKIKHKTIYKLEAAIVELLLDNFL
jgi:Zn-dependent peptidase ImmA (M78 family)